MPSRSSSRRRHRQARTNRLDELFAVAPLWVCHVAAAGVVLAALVGSQSVLHWRSSTATDAVEWTAALVVLVGLLEVRRTWVRTQILRRTRSLDELRALSWQAFEALVADAYRGDGWSVRETGALSGAARMEVLTW